MATSGYYFRVATSNIVSGDFLFVPPSANYNDSWSGTRNYPWSYGGESGTITTTYERGNNSSWQGVYFIFFDAPETITINGVKYGFLCNARIRESNYAAYYTTVRNEAISIPYESIGHYYFFTSIYKELPKYTIDLKASPSYGGSVSGNGTFYKGDSITVTATPATHFAFVKWQDGDGNTVSTNASYTFTASKNITLTAVFASTESLVVFNANGGSVSPAFKSIYKGDTYGTLPTPTRSGYTFAGWYTSASGGSRVYSSTTVTTSGNHSIYAHWTASAAASSTVTFNANGGSTSLTTLTMTMDATTNSLVAVASRSNYSFLGWFIASSGGEMVFGPTGEAVAGSFWSDDYSASSNNAKWSTSGAKTLYAHWGNHTCTVTFDPNWGSESSTQATYLDGKPYGSLPVPSRSGYNFAGWYTAASGGSLVTPADNASTTTLYAHWERPDSVTWLLVTIT